MDHLSPTPRVLVSFRQLYEQNISPKLKTIDLFLKTTEGHYSISEVAVVLGMSVDEMTTIMKENDIISIQYVDFFTIISRSSSYICRLINRQWKYASASFYTPYMIAYIYELNIDKVQSAFKQLDKEYILEEELMDVFTHIYTPIYRLS